MITSTNALLGDFGAQLKRVRLRKEIDQFTLAEQANISITALKNLESGKGASLKTLIKTLCALGKENWLSTIAPEVSISPMQLLKKRTERKRAPRLQKKDHA